MSGRAAARHRGVPAACIDDRGRAPSRRARPACSRRCSTAAATSPSSRPSTPSRPRAGSRTWPSSLGAAAEFETVDEFLEQVSLVADTDELDADESYVVLMTLHSAKGLEFPNVFIIGLEDGVFPHLRSLGEPDELEEERRLAYVGITRARERLYLTHAWSRMLFGSHAVQPAEPVPRRDPGRPRHRRSKAAGGRPAARGSGWGDDRWSGGGSGRRSSEGRDRIVERAPCARGARRRAAPRRSG